MNVEELCEIFRDGFSEIRDDRREEFVQKSKRKTCKFLEKTDGTTRASRSNSFDVFEADRK